MLDFGDRPHVKMETRHPIEGQFGSEFPAICNHCVVMTAWSRKTWKFCEQFLCFFFEKRPLMVKFSEFYFECLHGDTDRRCCVEMSWNLSDGKSAISCVIYLTKNFGCLWNCRYWADRAQNLPGSAPSNVTTLLLTLSKSVNFRRSYSRTREHRFLPRRVFPRIIIKRMR